MTDPHENIPTAIIGKSKYQNMLLQIRRNDSIGVVDISTKKLIDIYYKTKFKSNFLYLSTDCLKGQLVIDYTTKYYNQDKPYYIRQVLIVNQNKWVSINFQGIDTIGLRDTIQQITNSLIIK
ncbi:hypothetical protein QMK33_22750 [Hymenobacter sp. H14-R3]|uniref:hypothetical protein n=1 Tax=Hymenobacter sp. H14-R3 TaxID=3046308 RepID=UPI0024B951E7|nr:hypothetical protein [Hymenobacter sp. H14-R3]MDJ0367971.1 hypothetical protein [Hymenobacter sp. H14-R3]